MPNEEAVPKDTEPDDDAPLRVKILCTRSRSRSRSPRRPNAAEMMTAATASLQQTIAAWRDRCLQAEAELDEMEKRVEYLVGECDDLRGYSKNLEAELDSWVSLLGQRRELQSIERESMPELQHISLEGCKQVFAKKAFEL
jgi:predicted  nucleic acid-binding Zn-ribbon protein